MSGTTKPKCPPTSEFATGSEAAKSGTQKVKAPGKQADRLRFLADRAAILLVVCKMRYGNDWNPWFREGIFEDEGSLGDEIRGWPEYQSAMMVVRNWLKKHGAKSDTTDAA